MSARLRTALVSAILAGAVILPALSGTGGLPAPGPRASDLGARRIIERALQVHGGREAWLGKKDAAFSTTWTYFRGGQASFSSRYLVKFPIESGPVRAVVEGDENGKPVVMGVSGSRSWFLVGAERYEDLDSLKANRAFVKKAWSLLALPFRLDDPSYRFTYDGEEVRGGALVDRVRVEHGLEPAGLYLFDRETGRLVGLGSPVARPPTSTVSEYRDFTEVDGILIPRLQAFDRIDARTGDRSRAFMVSVDTVRFGNRFAPETFEPPPIP